MLSILTVLFLQFAANAEINQLQAWLIEFDKNEHQFMELFHDGNIERLKQFKQSLAQQKKRLDEISLDPKYDNDRAACRKSIDGLIAATDFISNRPGFKNGPSPEDLKGIEKFQQSQQAIEKLDYGQSNPTPLKGWVAALRIDLQKFVAIVQRLRAGANADLTNEARALAEKLTRDRDSLEKMLFSRKGKLNEAKQSAIEAVSILITASSKIAEGLRLKRPASEIAMSIEMQRARAADKLRNADETIEMIPHFNAVEEWESDSKPLADWIAKLKRDLQRLGSIVEGSQIPSARNTTREAEDLRDKLSRERPSLEKLAVPQTGRLNEAKQSALNAMSTLITASSKVAEALRQKQSPQELSKDVGSYEVQVADNLKDAEMALQSPQSELAKKNLAVPPEGCKAYGGAKKMSDSMRAIPNIIPDSGGQVRGFSIFAVQQNGFFGQVGLRSGDLLVAVDGQPVNSAIGASKLIDFSKSSTLKYTIERGGQTQILTATCPDSRKN